MNKIIYYILLPLICIWGIFLRYFDLWVPSMWIDEWYSSFISYISFQNQFIPYLPAGRYDFWSYFFTIFQSICYSFFWYSDFASRLPSFVFWVAQILVVFLFAKSLFQETKYKNIWVIFVTFLFTFSTWQIIWSREARFYEMLSFLYLLGVFFLYQYIKSAEHRYIIAFFILAFIWLVFHPFCFALFWVWILILLLTVWEKYMQTKNIWVLKYLLLPMLSFTGYILVYSIFRYISGNTIHVSEMIPNSLSLDESYKKAYTLFYLKSIFSQLWVLIFAYLWGLFYFLWNKKWKEFLLFWLIVFLNFYVITQKWFVAHSRYLFHIYSIIMLVWGYFLVVIFGNLFLFWQKSWQKLFLVIVMIWVWGSIAYTYNFTFLPQKTYYIDATSPKPNFKLAYEALAEKKDLKIVSGFPQMCYLYNIKNPSVCEYALNINLTGSKQTLQEIQKETFHNYTKTPYLKMMSQIEAENYYFVLDDLTLKNAVDVDVINYVKQNCEMIYSDVWNGESENFIWIWRCLR